MVCLKSHSIWIKESFRSEVSLSVHVNLHQPVFCTDVPPIHHLGASLGWTPSQHRRPEQSPGPSSHSVYPSPPGWRSSGDWGEQQRKPICYKPGAKETTETVCDSDDLSSPHLCAVVVMASTTSMMRWRAESVPMVMSVPQKSLSIEPTMPTMLRWDDVLASSSLILPGDREVPHFCQLYSTAIPPM